jgi:hypothetical protein
MSRLGQIRPYVLPRANARSRSESGQCRGLRRDHDAAAALRSVGPRPAGLVGRPRGDSPRPAAPCPAADLNGKDRPASSARLDSRRTQAVTTWRTMTATSLRWPCRGGADHLGAPHHVGRPRKRPRPRRRDSCAPAHVRSGARRAAAPPAVCALAWPSPIGEQWHRSSPGWMRGLR